MGNQIATQINQRSFYIYKSVTSWTAELLTLNDLKILSPTQSPAMFLTRSMPIPSTSISGSLPWSQRPLPTRSREVKLVTMKTILSNHLLWRLGLQNDVRVTWGGSSSSGTNSLATELLKTLVVEEIMNDHVDSSVGELQRKLVEGEMDGFVENVGVLLGVC